MEDRLEHPDTVGPGTESEREDIGISSHSFTVSFFVCRVKWCNGQCFSFPTGEIRSDRKSRRSVTGG